MPAIAICERCGDAHWTDRLHDCICRIPPLGWWCSRSSGHEGPCAARPINPAKDICNKLYSRFDDEPDFLGIEAAHLIEIMGEAIQRIHRYAIAAEGVGYDLILSVTDPIINLAPIEAFGGDVKQAPSRSDESGIKLLKR